MSQTISFSLNQFRTSCVKFFFDWITLLRGYSFGPFVFNRWAVEEKYEYVFFLRCSCLFVVYYWNRRYTNASGKPDWLSWRGCSACSFSPSLPVSFPLYFIKILPRWSGRRNVKKTRVLCSIFSILCVFFFLHLRCMKKDYL